MGRRAKSAKAKVESKQLPVRKSRATGSLGRRELEQRLAESLEREQATADILRVISSSPTAVQPVFEAIVQNAVRLCEAANGTVFRFDGSLIHVAAHHARSPEAADVLRRVFPIPPGKGTVSGRAILTRAVTHVPDVLSDPEHTYSALFETGSRAILSVPMLRDGAPIGAIAVTRLEPGPFSGDKITLLETFAAQAVIAIENVRLFTELQTSNRDLTQALEQQTATSEILGVISASPTDLQPVVNAVATRAACLCEAFDATILLVDRDGLRVVAHEGPIAAHSVGQGPALDRGTPAGRAVLDRRTIHVADVQAEVDEYPAGSANARRFGSRTALVVPLLRAGEAIGAIAVRRTEVRSFTERQIDLLKTFADQAVIAIENVQLFKELGERNTELAESLRRQTATGEILTVISQTLTDSQKVFDAIARNAAALCEGDGCGVFRRVGDRVARVARAITTDRTVDTSAPDPWLDGLVPLDQTSVGRVILSGAVLNVPDTEDQPDQRLRDTARANGFRSVLTVVMLRDTEPIGAISVTRRRPGSFSDAQLQLLKTFADQAVIAIENVRLFTETKEALERQTATSEILRVISSSPTDVQPVFDTIARSATTLCEADLSGLYPFDGAVIYFAAEHGRTPAETAAARRAFPQPPSRLSVTARAILTAAVVQVADVSEEPEVADSLRMFRTVLSMPMLQDGRPLGAITVARRVVRPFTDKQIELLQTFADQAVIAIENVRLFTELQEKNRALTKAHEQVSESLEQQTATSEILRVISGSPTDTQPVFDAIVTNAARLCDARDVFLVVVEDDALRAVAATGQSAALIEDYNARRVPISRGSVAGRTIVDRATMHVPDLAAASEEEFPEGRAVQRLFGHRTMLATPLLRDDVAVGAIVAFRFEVRLFSERQIALLQTFADQAVIAIENVRLFKELQEKNRALTEAHAQVSEALEQQTATSDILRVISSSPTDVQPVFDTIVRHGMRLTGAARCVLLGFDGEMLNVLAMHNVRPEGIDLIHRVFPLRASRQSVPGRAVLDRTPAHIPDVAHDPEFGFHEAARAVDFRAVLAVPMMRGGIPIGAIVVQRPEPRAFMESEIELLKTFAEQAVIAIENVRLFNETKEALEQQTATSDILRVISRSPTDEKPVFDAIAASSVRLCDGVFSLIAIFDGEVLHLVAHEHVGTEGLRAVTAAYPMRPNREHLAGRAILDRTVIHVADVTLDPDYVGAAGVGNRATLSVPMLRKGEPIGTITIGRLEPIPFTDRQIDLLKTFADQGVIAIENVRLFKELEARTQDLTRSVGELRALGEVGQAISSTLDLEMVLTTIVSRAVQLSGLDGGVVFEYDQGAEEFVQRVATDTVLAQARRTTRIRKGEGVLGRTAITLEPVQVPDITVPGAYEGRAREALIESGVRAILAVPMVREGQLIGCLGVTRNRPGEFQAETIEMLRTFATQSALAIQNARLFHEIADKSRQLEAASQHKSEFLANMSHELRTPLNAILGFSEVLAQGMFGAVNEKQTEYLHDILESGRHLLSLINDILDLSKIEAGRMELELSEFDLPQAIQNALTLVRERALRRGIALQHRIDPRLASIRADERKVKQVLLNLLSNAIKFTPEGGRIEVRAAPKDELVQVSVADTGIGIAAEDLETVFEEFRQVGTADKKAEGTGLGLALAKKFVELHGGRIWIESEVGRGSTFTFTLPVA